MLGITRPALVDGVGTSRLTGLKNCTQFFQIREMALLLYVIKCE